MRFKSAVAFVLCAFTVDSGVGQTTQPANSAQRSSAFVPPPISNDQTVLVTGSPVLKRATVENLILYYSWLFETQIPDDLRASIQNAIVADWKSHNQSGMKADLEFALGYEKIAEL